jgi:hypothetical protein
VTDESQGVQLATTQALARYWATDYDWRKCEAKLNALPQFMTEIDGPDIHFIHVRSKHKSALPIIVTHGVAWLDHRAAQDHRSAHRSNGLREMRRGCVRRRDSVDAGLRVFRQAHHTGWDPQHIARAWVVLMKRFGYTKFVAQGGDWGALITDEMGVLAPPELLAININMPGAVPPDISKATFLGDPPPSSLSAEEKHAYDQLAFFLQARPGLCSGNGEPPPDAVRDYGFTGGSGRLDPRPRRAQLRADRTRL